MDFLTKTQFESSFRLKESWMNHRILVNTAKQISYIFSEILHWPDSPTAWIELTWFFMNSWHCKGKKWLLDLTISCETGDFYLETHHVPLVGLAESGMDHSLWANNATTNFLPFFRNLTVLDWPSLSELLLLFPWTCLYCKVKINGWIWQFAWRMWISCPKFTMFPYWD